jgi:peptidoglycan/xylan/chitin deacetylase (PgdA/CDA1 family)
LEAARTVLYPRGLPSIFFVNPGLLDRESISLDSTLAWCANSIGLQRLSTEIGVSPIGNISALIGHEMSKRTANERAALKTHLLTKFGLDGLEGRSPILKSTDIAEFHKFGIEVGNHTRTHVHCRALNEKEQATEIVTAKVQLEALSGRRVRSFAVPYGSESDLTPEILQELRASGHEAIFLVHARSNRFRPSNDVWYRVNLTNESPFSLTLRLKTLPILRSLKKMI